MTEGTPHSEYLLNAYLRRYLTESRQLTADRLTHGKHEEDPVNHPGDADGVHCVADPLALAEVAVDVADEEGVERGHDGQDDVVHLRQAHVQGVPLADLDMASDAIHVLYFRVVECDPD